MGDGGRSCAEPTSYGERRASAASESYVFSANAVSGQVKGESYFVQLRQPV